ncbi:MAG TPA: hypothetical protein VGA36_09135 [Nitriliruptorales bacterium]
MRGTRIAVAVLGASVLALAACGDDAPAADVGDAGAPQVAGMCAEDTPDCADMIDAGQGTDAGEPDGNGDQFDSDSEREAAAALIGLAEADLAADVRIGRRGDEHMMLTEDYVLGRKTVELDADADGVFRVTSVTVELPDGPETITA